jgi:hypothetical protein
MNKTNNFLLKTFIYRIILDFTYTLILSYIVFGRLSGSITYAVANLILGMILYFAFINVYDRNFPIKVKLIVLGLWILGAVSFIVYVVMEGNKNNKELEEKAKTDKIAKIELDNRKRFWIK